VNSRLGNTLRRGGCGRIAQGRDIRSAISAFDCCGSYQLRAIGAFLHVAGVDRLLFHDRLILGPTRARMKPNGPSKIPKANQPQPLRPLFVATTAATIPNRSHNTRANSKHPPVVFAARASARPVGRGKLKRSRYCRQVVSHSRPTPCIEETLTTSSRLPTRRGRELALISWATQPSSRTTDAAASRWA